jgi:hypothetical protein
MFRKCIFQKNVSKTNIFISVFVWNTNTFAKIFAKCLQSENFRENVWNTNIFAKILGFSEIFAKNVVK